MRNRQLGQKFGRANLVTIILWLDPGERRGLSKIQQVSLQLLLGMQDTYTLPFLKTRVNVRVGSFCPVFQKLVE